MREQKRHRHMVRHTEMAGHRHTHTQTHTNTNRQTDKHISYLSISTHSDTDKEWDKHTYSQTLHCCTTSTISKGSCLTLSL